MKKEVEGEEFEIHLMVCRILRDGTQIFDLYSRNEAADKEREVYEDAGAREVMRVWVKEVPTYQATSNEELDREGYPR